MIRSKELLERKASADTLLPGRAHERFDQLHRGVRVWGADVSRQLQDGVTVSVYGTLYPDLDVDITPTLTRDDASRRAERHVERGDAYSLALPELVILPNEDGAKLAYLVTVHSRANCFTVLIDAKTGDVLLSYSNRQTQTATVGVGTGIVGDRKKVSASSFAGAYVADDQLRPPDRFRTFDLKGDVNTTGAVLYGGRSLFYSDLASDSDNTWQDPAVVDAHVYAGWTYDYFYKRFNRRGLDDQDSRILSIVHPIKRQEMLNWYNSPYWDDVQSFYLNAFYDKDWGGLMVYGEGLPENLTLDGQHYNYWSGALDVVSHELTHGVTSFSSRLIYRNESGALNESFSDIMATGVEWFHQAPGQSGVLGVADYLIAEDVVTPGGIRSMSDPVAYGGRDHYSRRYVGAEDAGGIHINSGIGNNAYYLAVEGGTNRISGLAVQGVGRGNREQMEKVFYRAFVYMLPSSATFATARAATIQAARDLYGAGSGVERAVTQAWAAVGVFPATALNVSFSPSPAIGTKQCQFSTVPCWKFRTTVTETGGQGTSVESVSAVEYDDNGRQTSAHWTFSFPEYFDNCGPGSTRIDAFGSACVNWEWNLGGRSSGHVKFEITGRSDDGTRRTFEGVQRLAPVGATGLSLLIDSADHGGQWRAKPDRLLEKE